MKEYGKMKSRKVSTATIATKYQATLIDSNGSGLVDTVEFDCTSPAVPNSSVMPLGAAGVPKFSKLRRKVLKLEDLDIGIVDACAVDVQGNGKADVIVHGKGHSAQSLFLMIIIPYH
jgi:hypothetical protein